MSDTNYPPISLLGPVGRPIVRKSGREKVSGTAIFTAEWPVEGLMHAVPVPSTIARGTIVSIDDSEAKKMPGVRFVLTPDNVTPSVDAKPPNGPNQLPSTCRWQSRRLGTGKTATIRAIAEDFNLPIFAFNLATFFDDELIERWQSIRSSVRACRVGIGDRL